MSRQTFGSIPAGIKTALLPVCFTGLLGILFALSALIMQRAKLAYLILQGGSVALILSLLLFGFPLLEPWKSSREAAETVLFKDRLLYLLQPPLDGLLTWHVDLPGITRW
jgi:hypothetical protein